MTYPPAPWTLKGNLFVSLSLINIADARPFIPETLDIREVLPQKTLGGIYLANYTSDSTMAYGELIVFPGLARYRDRARSWISHIYVDNPDSIAGGREIWGLPKEMAEFHWQSDRALVRQNDTILYEVRYRQPWIKLPVSSSLKTFSQLDGKFVEFIAQFRLNLGWVNATGRVPPDSPFAPLHLDRPFLTFASPDTEAVVDAPEVV